MFKSFSIFEQRDEEQLKPEQRSLRCAAPVKTFILPECSFYILCAVRLLPRIFQKKRLTHGLFRNRYEALFMLLTFFDFY